jgi:hypothetical protein
VFEFIAQGIFEVLLYGTGKVVCMLFLPHLGIEPFEKQKPMPRFKWWAFTYVKNDRRFLHTESVQFVGLIFWVLISAWVFLVLQLKT